MDSVQLGLMYEKLKNYKEIIIDPIFLQNTTRRVTLGVKTQSNLRRNELIKNSKEAPEIISIEKDKITLSNILILYNNMLQSLFSSQI